MMWCFRRHFNALLASVFFLSCSPREEEPLPSGILGKDKMVAVLVDIHLGEAAADNRNLSANQVNEVMAGRYSELYARHGITTRQFVSSYNYYLEHAELLSPIYAEVVNQLTTRESGIRESRKLPRVSNDSMRNVEVVVPDSALKK
jgi:hypothetical protein